MAYRSRMVSRIGSSYRMETSGSHARMDGRHTGKTGQWWKAEAALESGQSGSRSGRRSSAQFASGPADEDVVAGRVQHPVVTFARVVVVARHLDETLVERQVVADRVLPSLFVVPVVREVLHDELVDAVECQALLGAAPNGHHDEGVVGEGRLLVLLALLVAAAARLSAARRWLVAFSLFVAFAAAFVVLAGRFAVGLAQVDGAGRLWGAVEILDAGLLFAFVGTERAGRFHALDVEILLLVGVDVVDFAVVTVHVLLHAGRRRSGRVRPEVLLRLLVVVVLGRLVVVVMMDRRLREERQDGEWWRCTGHGRLWQRLRALHFDHLARRIWIRSQFACQFPAMRYPFSARLVHSILVTLLFFFVLHTFSGGKRNSQRNSREKLTDHKRSNGEIATLGLVRNGTSRGLSWWALARRVMPSRDAVRVFNVFRKGADPPFFWLSLFVCPLEDSTRKGQSPAADGPPIAKQMGGTYAGRKGDVAWASRERVGRQSPPTCNNIFIQYCYYYVGTTHETRWKAARTHLFFFFLCVYFIPSTHTYYMDSLGTHIFGSPPAYNIDKYFLIFWDPKVPPAFSTRFPNLFSPRLFILLDKSIAQLENKRRGGGRLIVGISRDRICFTWRSLG